MQDIFDYTLNQSIAFLPKFGIALIIFFLSWQIGNIVKKIIFRISKDFDEGKKQVLRLLGSSIRVAILIFGGVQRLGTWE